MKKSFFILLGVCLACSPISAQYDTQVSNYWAIPSYYNPAYAGESGNLEASLLSRIQWLGIERAPRSTIITAEMPFAFMNRLHGVGLSMYNDRAGLFSSTVISGQYAWKKRIAKGDFSLGIQGGYINQTFDGSKVYIPESNVHEGTDDAIPLSEVNGTSIDIALGLFYSHKAPRGKWYTGLSVTHLLAPELELGENYVLEIPRTYYFTAGYNIQLNNPLIELRPSVLVKTMEMSSIKIEQDSLIGKVEEDALKAMWKNTQIDVSLRMIYNKRFMGGLAWRNGDAVVVSLGAKFKMLEVGYAYDLPISRIIKESTGSHELFVKCVIDLNLKRGTRNRHKSVRVL